MTEANRQDVARALGRLPSGCAILTARAEGRRTGILASWVQQAAFEPPMLSVALKKDRPIGDLIRRSGEFVVNVLGENPTAMFKHFGKGFSPEEDSFAGLSAREVACGIEIADQIARLSVKLRGSLDAGDHEVFVGEVVEASASTELLPPYVHVRKNGLSY